jgi:hypothetical protein
MRLAVRCLAVLVAGLAAVLAFVPTAMAAPPSNDDIANAVAVTSLPFSDTRSTVEATEAPTDPSCAGAGPTVWYAVTLKKDATVTASTAGSSYDTTLSAYTGTPGSLTQIACNDDFTGLQSQITFTAPRRETIYVMVGAFGGGLGGNLVLSITGTEAPKRSVQSPVGLNRRVSGSVTASGFFEFSSRGCPFVYEQLDGTYDTKKGTGSFHVEGCVDLASVPGGFLLVGTFTITTPQGDRISGTAQGTVFPLDLTLTVTDVAGSPSLKNVGGTIRLTLDGISGSNLQGTLTGSLKHNPR